MFALILAVSSSGSVIAAPNCLPVGDSLRICEGTSELGRAWFSKTSDGNPELASSFGGRAFSMGWRADRFDGGEVEAIELRAKYLSEVNQASDEWRTSVVSIEGVEFFESARSDLEGEIPTALAVSLAVVGDEDIGFVTSVVAPPEGFDIVEAHRFLLSHLERAQ
ncbi:MAG: hypothetical protein AAFU55_09920 [Pseudomonadota bacterium]